MWKLAATIIGLFAVVFHYASLLLDMVGRGMTLAQISVLGDFVAAYPVIVTEALPAAMIVCAIGLFTSRWWRPWLADRRAPIQMVFDPENIGGPYHERTIRRTPMNPHDENDILVQRGNQYRVILRNGSRLTVKGVHAFLDWGSWQENLNFSRTSMEHMDLHPKAEELMDVYWQADRNYADEEMIRLLGPALSRPCTLVVRGEGVPEVRKQFLVVHAVVPFLRPL